MKADLNKMFSVPLDKLQADAAPPFPVYIYLKRNDKFVPMRLAGDPIGTQKYQQLRRGQLQELWIPKDFLEAFNRYLEGIGQAPLTSAPEKEILPPAGASAEPQAAVVPKSEEAALTRDVLEDEELTSEEKAQVLSALSQDLLRSLNQITTRGEPARADGLRRCREIADEILSVAAANSNIYEEILALRQSQEDIEHSIIVGTVATMFALAIGFVDENLLADITVAALFHDVGLVKVKPEVVAKPERTWSASERKEYEQHVMSSLEILRESASQFDPRVFRMIKEHHENYDGSGFPEGLKGAQIDELSQLIHMANLFDRLCTGKQTAQDLSPAEAFDYIYAAARDPKAVHEIQPELVERVFQFMLTEKEAADKLRAEAEGRMNEAAKGVAG
ncbi:MAG: HD domain-containing protein [Bdellovibrionales bacterium]|nr:HD domain-containing protein [Bdellovibrionales bacterium]